MTNTTHKHIKTNTLQTKQRKETSWDIEAKWRMS